MDSIPNAKILLAEPSATFRTFYHSIFEKEGFEVSEVENVDDLFRKLYNLSFDLLLIDPVLFGKDGPNLIHKITEFFPGCKVVINTAIVDPQWVEVAGLEGFADYFIKGQVSANSMVTRVEEIMDYVALQESEGTALKAAAL